MTSGEVAKAIASEDRLAKVGSRYGIDLNDAKAVLALMKKYKKAVDPDKIRAYGQLKAKVEALVQRRQDLWNQAADAFSHMKNLDELKNIEKARKSGDPAFEWGYDLSLSLLKAALDIDPAKLVGSSVQAVLELAGSDWIKDNVKKLEEEIVAVEDTFNKAVTKLQKFTAAEMKTYQKTLDRLLKDYQKTAADLGDALPEFQAAARGILPQDGAANQCQEAQVVAKVEPEIKATLNTINTALQHVSDQATSMAAGGGIRDPKWRTLLVPIGSYVKNSSDGSLAYYQKSGKWNGFNISGSIKRPRVEQMAKELPAALKRLDELNEVAARVRDLWAEWNRTKDHVLGV